MRLILFARPHAGEAFGRWRIERCFEDGKGEVRLDHWEGRRWLGLNRHLILTTVSYLFLAKACQRLRGENREWTVCQVRVAADALIQSWQLQPHDRDRLHAKTAKSIQYHQRRNSLAHACRTRTTICKLHRLGIKFTNLPRCDENTSYRCSINTRRTTRSSRYVRQ